MKVNPDQVRTAAVETLLKAFEAADTIPDLDVRRAFVKAQNEAVVFFVVTRSLAIEGVPYTTETVEAITNQLLAALKSSIETHDNTN